jgi:dihydrofolate synthase/folylpolyglutamate synthase
MVRPRKEQGITMRDLTLWQKQEYTGMKPGLTRIRRFLRMVGNPQETFRVIHIAGTNGKGSTARMLSKILEKSGYGTGLYVSPHLVSMGERIRIDSKAISERELGRLNREFSDTAEQCGLTFFEYITGLAFIYFARRRVAYAVLETGMGGRYDATNVVRRPMVSIITDVDFDHRQFLGNTLAEIAGEKAGIIKRSSYFYSPF